MAFHYRLFTLTKSHDIIVPLVWASTVTSYVGISVIFTSVCRSKTLSPFTIIHMQVVNVWLQICVAIVDWDVKPQHKQKSALLSGLTVLKL